MYFLSYFSIQYYLYLKASYDLMTSEHKSVAARVYQYNMYISARALPTQTGLTQEKLKT